MKVLFLSDDFPPASFGGAGLSTFELAQAIQAEGHEVAVVTTCRAVVEAGESSYEGLTVYKIHSNYDGRWRGWRGVKNPPALRALDTILKEVRPDVVHANNVHYYLSFASVKRARRYAPVVWTARDLMAVCYGKLDTERYLTRGDARITWLDNLRYAKLRYNPFKSIRVRHYLSGAHCCAVSEALRDALITNGIRGVEAVHTGISSEAWHAAPEVAAVFKARFNVAGRHVVLFAGRLSPEKGGEKAIEALGEVAKQDRSALLLVAGPEDGYARVMKKKAERVGLASHLVFTGWLAHDEMRAAYAASDVVWVPSIYLDPLPRTVLEAMAAGRPVIATSYGGAKEAVEDGVTGYVVDPRSAQQIAEKTIPILTDPAHAAALGRAAAERIARDLDLSTYAHRYLEVYSRALATPRRTN